MKRSQKHDNPYSGNKIVSIVDQFIEKSEVTEFVNQNFLADFVN